MDETKSRDIPPMSPRLARILPLVMTAIIPIVAFAVGRAYGHESRYAATAGIIFAGSTLTGWGVLLLFGRPVQGDVAFWILSPGFMFTLLTPRVTMIPYATIFTQTFFMSFVMVVFMATIGRALNRQWHSDLHRPRERDGSTGGDR